MKILRSSRLSLIMPNTVKSISISLKHSEFDINKNREELLLDEEIIRKHLRLLDLQEERLNMRSGLSSSAYCCTLMIDNTIELSIINN
jgi:hypothetical protein